jgi:NADP-dependent 3-hydroxy acid dehydrogenase YdfG
VRRGFARAQERGSQIEAHDEVPFADVGFPDASRLTAADIVDQDVDLAMRRQHGREQRAHGVLLGHIRVIDRAVPLHAVISRSVSSSPSRSMSVTTRRSAFLGKPKRDRAAEPARGPGDDGDPVRDPSAHSFAQGKLLCAVGLSVTGHHALPHVVARGDIIMVRGLNGVGEQMAQADTAIVTGGAGGIGKATVRRLLDRGMSVFIIDANEGSLQAVLSEFGNASPRLDGCVADVLDEQQVIRSVGQAVQRFSGVYALVHVAGGAGPKRARDIEDFQLSEWSHVIDLNLTSAFLAARAVVPLMRKQRRGRIVVFSSVIADGEKGPLTTVTGRLPYATAKAALLGFTSQLAKDLASSASR